MHAQPAPTREESTAHRQADAEYYRRVLHSLIDMGAELAGLVLQQARSQGEAAAPADLAVAFDRVARSVRRTVLLARRLDEAPQPAPAQPRIAARKRILREVEDAIQRTAKGDAADSLHAELLDRLDAPDLDEEIDTRPVPEIIADICRDLGIAHPPGSHPWKRRTPADIAELRARAEHPGAPVPLAFHRVPPPDRPPRFRET
jgi:hypothetical protein